eukprot:9471046-Pyramimonas_sp.AAC.1
MVVVVVVVVVRPSIEARGSRLEGRFSSPIDRGSRLEAGRSIEARDSREVEAAALARQQAAVAAGQPDVVVVVVVVVVVAVAVIAVAAVVVLFILPATPLSSSLGH